MNDLSAFCPHPALPDELGRLTAPSPPEVFLLAKEVAWEDLACVEGKMFGSLSKKGREIESDTWQGSLPGQHAREAGPHPGQALPGQPLAGVLAEARSGCAAGLCSGWKVGRPPAGNGKAQTLVMAGLLCLCIDVNNRRGICNFLPKMLRFPVTASEGMLEPLLEPSCHHCFTLTSSVP